ncbi:hypothetical protein WDU94_002438 [Cyamophila willieti]
MAKREVGRPVFQVSIMNIPSMDGFPSNHCEGITVRKISSQNIIHKLTSRELGILRSTKSFYLNVFPNVTVVNIPKPSCYLRKFTPNGKYFIAFSADQTSVEIYEYCGVHQCETLLQNIKKEYIGESNPHDEVVRNQIFNTVFKLKHVINIVQGNELLNRECSLVTDNGKFIIVGAAAMIPDDLRPHFYEIYTNNESVTPSARSQLEDYSIHLIDITHGKLTDTKHFKTDKIMLSHNQGLYLYKDTLAILSLQHQNIHIFQIVDGMFVEVRSVGRFCYEDDAYILSNVYTQSPSARPFKDPFISSLKHRVLVAMYKQAKASPNQPYELRKFHKFFDEYRNVRLWKMQLLDENHLLLKYASEDVVTFKTTESVYSQHYFFVFYNMITSQVLAVFENTSEALVQLFEHFTDCFRNARLPHAPEFVCSPSNNIYAKANLQRFKSTIISAKFGGHREATKRLLTQLPISAQSYCCSPYLDYSLFSYDDKWISALERPKPCGEHGIRFFSRESGLLKFQIHPGAKPSTVSQSQRRLVAFTFHPTDPFVISVQRTNADYVVNFHLRHDPALPSVERKKELSS